MIATREALAPVVDALLRRARADAETIITTAEDEAAEMIAAARWEAQAVLAEARASGAAQARAYAAMEHARAQRRARRVELAAQREVLEELRGRAVTAVRSLRDDPCYPRLLERLGELARQAGGGDLVVSEHSDGGVVAEGRGRRVDCTLDALAGRAVDALGGEVERLWAP
ncbi:V-type ATP synthase subunit E family protein [Streptosporangium canum]|uniref:V-type ATP synthase subunit E family protein n=1 Tax=Streptosporangium canum TaxID=324952 RepID=UPI0036C52F2A